MHKYMLPCHGLLEALRGGMRFYSDRRLQGDEIELGQHFFTKRWPKQSEKAKKLFQNICKNTNNAKRSFPRGAISRKYIFFQWILQVLKCNKYPQNGNWDFFMDCANFHVQLVGLRWHFFAEMRGQRGKVFEDFASKQLSKLCFPPRAGSTFLKKRAKFNRKGCVEQYKRK